MKNVFREEEDHICLNAMFVDYFLFNFKKFENSVQFVVLTGTYCTKISPGIIIEPCLQNQM